MQRSPGYAKAKKGQVPVLVSGVKGRQPARVYEKGVAHRSKSNSKSFWKCVSLNKDD